MRQLDKLLKINKNPLILIASKGNGSNTFLRSIIFLPSNES